MSTTTTTYLGTLVETTCWCGIHHAVPQELFDYVKRQHRDGVKQTSIYCPLGHVWIFAGQSEIERVRREKERLERVAMARQESIERLRDQRDAAQRKASAYKGQATRARNRAAAALCPVDGCGRSFVQIRRHLAAKHPDFQGLKEAWHPPMVSPT